MNMMVNVLQFVFMEKYMMIIIILNVDVNLKSVLHVQEKLLIINYAQNAILIIIKLRMIH